MTDGKNDFMYLQKLLFLVFLALFSCSNRSEKHACEDSNVIRLSSLIRQYEEINRIQFRYCIVENHVKSSQSNFLNRGILDLTVQIDSIVNVLLESSEGMNSNGELVGGCTKIPKIVIEEIPNTIHNMRKMVEELKTNQISLPVSEGGAVIEAIESSLTYFSENYRTEKALTSSTVMVLMFDLILFNNYLLLLETKYYDSHSVCF